MLYNKIRFPISSTISNYWITANPENSDLFEDGTLVVYLQPGNYKPTYDRSSESGIKDGFSSSMVLVSAVRYGFELTIEDNRMAMFRCLASIQSKAETAIPNYYQPVECRDYVNPDDKDLAVGYTVRMGILQVELTGGTMMDDDDLGNPLITQWQFGCRAIFKEF